MYLGTLPKELGKGFGVGKLTLEQIAQMAGVSRSTVSRVVNHHPGVKPSIRERVLQVIQETGYHPDPAARSLAGRRSGLIGLVVPRAVQFLFIDPYYPRLMQGIAQACNSYDYILSLFLFHTEEEEQKLFPRLLRNQLVDGIIVSALPLDDSLVSQLLLNEIPFVMIGRPDNPTRISFVDVDNVAGAYSAVRHLIQLGRKRIATITGPLNTTVGLDRRQGYLNALNDRGMLIDGTLIVAGDFTEVSGYTGMQRLLCQKVDAVFAASDTMAFGALRAIRQAGVTVPDEIAVVGYDDLPLATTSEPPLTTVRQPIRRLGVQAVENLIDILANGRYPPRHVVTTTELIIRASCGSNLG
jgi:LacI family transcriptional regulator